jgi:ankyrin repeat protein
MMRLLIDKGAKLEHRTTALGVTPLIAAAGRGQTEAVRLLLDAGRRVEASATT